MRKKAECITVQRAKRICSIMKTKGSCFFSFNGLPQNWEVSGRDIFTHDSGSWRVVKISEMVTASFLGKPVDVLALKRGLLEMSKCT